MGSYGALHLNLQENRKLLLVSSHNTRVLPSFATLYIVGLGSSFGSIVFLQISDTCAGAGILPWCLRIDFTPGQDVPAAPQAFS